MEENPYKAPNANATENRTAQGVSEKTIRAILLITAAMSGALIWLGMPILIGEHEAWDSPWYWPLVMGANFVFGACQPRRPWQPVVALMSAQAIVFFVQVAIRPAPFALVGLLFMTVFLVVNLIIAYIAAGIVRLSRNIWHRVSRTA